MPRATGRNRPDPDDDPAGPPPRPAVDHTSAVGGNLPWPFAGDRPAEAEVVGIEIFDADAPAPATAAAPPADAAPPTEPLPAPTAEPRRGHGVPPAPGVRSAEEPPRPGSSRPASRASVPPRSRTRPPGPATGPVGTVGPLGRTPSRPRTAAADREDAPTEVLAAPAADAPADRPAPTEVLAVPPRDPARALPPEAAAAETHPDAPAARSVEPAERWPRPSFLVADPEVQPARHGLRGLLNRFGLSLPPSEAEDEERRSIALLSRAHERPRTVAVVNGKGGSNKTPTTAVLAAVLARYGGAGVLAWDNNETRGTLGWRTDDGGHGSSVRELLDASDDLLGPAASASDLARFVHHQGLDRYDVLRSGGPAGARLTRAQYDAVHRLARKYYRTVVVDSGNDESADRWQQMVDRADRLVVATTALGEHVESGMLLLEELAERGGRAAELAASAVVVVSQGDRDRHHGDARRVAAELGRSGITAVVVPYDRSLHSGRIRFDALGPASKRAWLTAAAVVADLA